MISYILAILTGLAVIGADQLTKALVLQQFSTLGASKPFLPGVINFTFVTNGGGAWGMLQDRTWLLLSITVIVMLICVTLLIKYGTENKVLFWAICLVLGGGIGNMIDRIFRHGEVVDFIDLSFMNFPVFNVADCAICIGAGLLVLYFIIGMINDEKEKRAKIAFAKQQTYVASADPRTTTEKINVSEQKQEASDDSVSADGEH